MVFRCASGRPVCTAARCEASTDFAYDEEDQPYKVSTRIITPTQLGIPSERVRKYTDINLRATIKDDANVKFADVFFRTCITDASVFLRAKDNVIAMELE